MKKILSLLIVAVMLFSLVACGGDPDVTTDSTQGTDATTGSDATTGGTQGTDATTNTTTNPDITTGTVVTPTVDFDEDNIILSFAAISDTQHKYSGIDTLAKFKSALKQLDDLALENSDGIDAVLFVGDLVQNAQTSQVKEFKATYEEILSPSSVPLIFSLGNHDVNCNAGYTYENLNMESFYSIFGDAYRSYEKETSDLSIGCTHTIINGYHFLCINPIDAEYIGTDDGGVKYSEAAKKWLDETLTKITTENPDQYVFVNTHPMVYGTTYGSTLLTGNHRWYTKDLTSILEKYSQVVTFGGHTHFPINDERSIMQNKFTSIGCGSVTYMAIENGFSNVSGTVPSDASKVSSGHLLEVDANGNVRITRMNFTDNSTYKEAWVISAPKADGSHLNSYTADRANSNVAPQMNGNIKVTTAEVGGSVVGSVTFDAGTDDDFVHHYVIKVTDVSTGSVVNEIKYLTDFYLYSTPAESMAKSLTVSLGSLKAGAEYKVEIIAVDSWDAQSAALTATVKVSNESTSVLPEAIVDVDFNADGTATDTKGNGTVELVGGATIGTKEFKHNGATKSLAALNVTASGQSGTLTIDKYTTETIGELYNGASGFTLEAFYISNNMSGTDKATAGILCATEYGGLGIATTNYGTPGFCTYTTQKNSYNYTYAKEKASATDLTHVVATGIVYDGKLYTAIYINGELAGSNELVGEIWITDARFTPYSNQLSIGNDIGPNGFPMKDFSCVDVKVYDVSLNANKVKTAYDNACALLK